MKKRINESTLNRIIKESVKKILVNEEMCRYEMGRGELSNEASYNRIYNALEGLKRIADTMADSGYYSTEESALRCYINYIEQEISFIRKNKQ